MSRWFLKHPSETDLALFAGGELGPFSRWRIERHIEQCAACERIAGEFFRLPDEINDLAELPDVNWNALAESIEGRVRSEAALETEPAGGFLSRPVWQAGAAVAALLCVVAVVRQAPWAGSPASSAKEESIAMDSSAPVGQSFRTGSKLAEARQRDDESPEDIAALAVRLEEKASPARKLQTTPAEADANMADSRETLVADSLAPMPPPAPPGSRARRVQSAAAPVGGSVEGFVVATEASRDALAEAEPGRAPLASRAAALRSLSKSKPGVLEEAARRVRTRLWQRYQSEGPEAIRAEMESIGHRQAETNRPTITAAGAVRRGGERMDVEIVRLEDAPIELVSASAYRLDGDISEPTVTVRNRANQGVQSFEVGWAMRDAAGRSHAAGGIESGAPGLRVRSSAAVGGRSAYRVEGVGVDSLQTYLNWAELSDGSQWLAERAKLESQGLADGSLETAEERRLHSLYAAGGVEAVVAELRPAP